MNVNVHLVAVFAVGQSSRQHPGLANSRSRTHKGVREADEVRRTRLRKTCDAIYDASLALLYPQACAACGASVEERACVPACGECWRRTNLFSTEDMMCRKCGVAAAVNIVGVEVDAVRCRRCDAESWTAARAIGEYGGALRSAILELKRRPFVGNRIVELLYAWQQTNPLDSATLVMPVPLHPERERERGFNQARVIAEKVAHRAHLPLDDASLARTKQTEPHRAGMDAEARRASVAGVFEIVRPRMIEGESVLLIDDVMTTGATASACAAPLLDAGARAVFVLTVARAL